MTIQRQRNYPYPERIDSIPSIESYLQSLYRSLTAEQVDRIFDFEDMVVDSLEISDLTISSTLKPTADNAVDIGATTLRFKDLYLAGNLKDDTVSISVAQAKDAYDKRVDTWGDGLEYSSFTASVDYNTTNLKITSTEIDTIQGIATTASPTFADLTLNGVLNVNADGTTGEYGVNLYSISSTYSTIAQSDAEGIASSSDLRIGLDETLRGLYLMDRGDIATDFGSTAYSHPTLAFINAAASQRSTISHENTSFTLTCVDGGGFIFNAKDYFGFYVNNASDIDATDVFWFGTNQDGTGELINDDNECKFFSIEPTINQTSTAGYTALNVNAVETGTGSGNKELLNLQVDGNDKFTVSSAGTVIIADGGSISLQEDITFTGATTENLIKIPDNLPVALDFTEDSNSYIKFVTTNNSEAVLFSQEVEITKSSALLLDINPGFTGTGDVINLTPSAAIDTVDAEWDGIHIGGENLDPSAVGADIHGIHVDFSGVDLTNSPHIDCIHSESPTSLSGGHAYHAEGEVHINVDATSGAAGEEYTGVDMVLATADSTGGDMHAIDVARSGAGSIAIAALGTHENIDVIHQDIGAFANADMIWEYDNDAPGWFDDTTGTVSIWDDKDDLLYVGHGSTFSEIKFIFSVVATKNLHFKFYFSTGSSNYTQFFPADDTDGATQNGSLRYTPASLSTWATDTVNGTANKYWIKIERTRNAGTGPTATSMQQLAPTTYSWDKNGAIASLSVSAGTLTSTGNLLISDGGNIGSASDTDAIAIASGGEVTLSQTLILSDVVDAATDTDKFLVLDGSNNVDFRTGAEVLSDIGAAASSHNMASHSDEDTYNILTSGTLAAGVATITGGLTVKTAAGDSVLNIDTYDTTPSDHSHLVLRTSDTDTVDTLSETQDNDIIGNINWNGVNSSSAWARGAIITVIQDGAAGASFVPVEMIFTTYSSTAQNTNQLVLANDGNVGVGTLSPYGDLEVGANNAKFIVSDNGSQDRFVTIEVKDDLPSIAWDTGDSLVLGVKNKSDDAGLLTEMMRINTSGDVLLPAVNSTDAGDYDLRYDALDGIVYNTSDKRQKKNFSPLRYGLTEILQLEPKRYDYFSGRMNQKKNKSIKISDESKKSFGLIAQEVWDIIPEAVYKPEDEKTAFWGLRENRLIPIFVNAIKELNTRIEALEAEA